MSEDSLRAALRAALRDALNRPPRHIGERWEDVVVSVMASAATEWFERQK